MKVGDIVKQRDGIIKKGGKPLKTKSVGIVISINEHVSVPQKWRKTIGRAIDVLWENGKLTENFAESSLIIVNEFDDILGFSCTCSVV